LWLACAGSIIAVAGIWLSRSSDPGNHSPTAIR
jgi:hypothetical protein